MDKSKGYELVNLKLIIEYDGKNYSGWQRQKKAGSVQQTIEDALSVLFSGESIKITGAGRTDAGVHAYGQCANFKIDKQKYIKFGNGKLINSLNAVLPGDILVKKISRVSPGFSARYSAKSREYIYRFTSTPKAIEREKLFEIKYNIDLRAAKNFCSAIEGVHSFRALCKNKTDDHDFNCDILKAQIKRKKNNIFEFTISANRFLHSMIRAVVGSLLKVSSGKMSLNDFKNKFKNGDEIKIQYVPSNALFLSKVNY